MRRLGALLALLALSSCTVVDSNRAGSVFLNANGTERRAFFQGSYSLPRKFVSYKIEANNRHLRSADHFKVTEAAPVAAMLVPDPSPNFRYDINYAPSRFSRDNLVIDMADQMLTSVTVSTQDQTGEALVNFAEAAAQIGRLGAGLSTRPRGDFTIAAPGSSSAGDADPVDKVVAQISFDPTDVTSVSRARERLGNMMRLRIQPEPRPVQLYPPCKHSICYRPLTTVLISFEERHSGNSTDFIVQVPDPHQIAGIDLERSAFVDRTTALTFTSGTLQKIDMTKPSEVAAAALLPVRIVEAVFTGAGNAITGLLGLRRNELQGSVDLLNAQAAYLQALVEYRNTLESVEDAGVDLERLQTGEETTLASGPATFGGTPGGAGGDGGAGSTGGTSEGPAVFGGTPSPGGSSASADTQRYIMTCTPNDGCVFEDANDG